MKSHLKSSSYQGMCSFQAMNVKYEETARRAIRLKLELERTNAELPTHLRAFEHIVHSDKHLCLNSNAQPYDELAKMVAEEGQEGKEEQYRNQPFIGDEAVKAYTMPPWPPNVTNLEAFKNILLNRKMLIKQAGGLYRGGTVDQGTSDGPQNEKEANDDSESEEREQMVNTFVNSNHSNLITEEPNEIQRVSAAPQNTDGPIIVRNQLDKPVSVVIKVEDAEIGAHYDNIQTCYGTEVTCNRSERSQNTRKDVSLTQPQVGALSQQAVSIVNGVEPSLEDGHEITMGENQIVSQTIDSCATFCPQPSTSTSQEVTILFNIYRLITAN